MADVSSQFSLERAADRLEIQHRVYQYCRGVDRLDYATARDAFHPDAFDDHGYYKGDVDGLLKGIFERHKAVPFSFHLIGNVFIEFSSQDEAMCESYALTWLDAGKTPEDEEKSMLIANRFVDHFTRREGAWRIAKRTVLPVTATTFSGPPPIPTKDWTQPTRDMNDPSQLLRKALGLIV
ncbi:nuclear transport factor 2 family protein [Rhizorhabdus argentea]|uniref:nuclear transport factor 2 family protein n=1 Tax=Rhizorhabdus argentea TaxID=1387174 RepID=UPI0030EB5B8D